MIYETIVTTINQDGHVHIAPMGIRMEAGRYLIQPFKPSATMDNLERTGHAVINMTDDVMIFAGCLTGRRDWPTTKARKIEGEVLEAALAHIEVAVDTREDDPQRPRFYCKAVHHENHTPFCGFNRAQAAVLEAAILVSRLGMLPMEKIDQEIEYLRIAIDKTAGEREQTAWEWLTTRIDEYKRERETAAL